MYVVLTVQSLFELDFWQNWLKFYDEIDLPVQIRTFYNINDPYANCLKFGGRFH